MNDLFEWNSGLKRQPTFILQVRFGFSVAVNVVIVVVGGIVVIVVVVVNVVIVVVVGIGVVQLETDRARAERCTTKTGGTWLEWPIVVSVFARKGDMDENWKLE